jgi:alpha-tubulin suppressor-like RCC1 family protein
MGSNNHGKLGIGKKDIKYVSTPQVVKHIQMYECAQVSCGWEHTAAVMKSGDFYIWGASKYGAIGSSMTQNAYSPVKFKFKLGSAMTQSSHQNALMKSVSCGARFTCAVDSK